MRLAAFCFDRTLSFVRLITLINLKCLIQRGNLDVFHISCGQQIDRCYCKYTYTHYYWQIQFIILDQTFSLLIKRKDIDIIFLKLSNHRHPMFKTFLFYIICSLNILISCTEIQLRIFLLQIENYSLNQVHLRQMSACLSCIYRNPCLVADPTIFVSLRTVLLFALNQKCTGIRP